MFFFGGGSETNLHVPAGGNGSTRTPGVTRLACPKDALSETGFLSNHRSQDVHPRDSPIYPRTRGEEDFAGKRGPPRDQTDF